jgi:3-oxoadipate enol-lactonase
MPTVEANGQSLYYEVHGDGPPLLCVMGLSGDTTAWALQVSAFGERHRAVFFDNRDVGQSSMAEPGYGIEDMAADTLALADALDLESFHLMGMSMGGAIAQRVALTAPERVRSLSLAVTFARGGRWSAALARTWSARAMRSSREERVDELLLLTMSEEFFENEGAHDYMRTMLLSNPNPQPAEAFVRQLEAASAHNARDELGALSMPVHVIGADHDILVPVWKSRDLAEAIPGAKLTVIPAAPHCANIERAAEFNAAVLDFVDQHQPASAKT